MTVKSPVKQIDYSKVITDPRLFMETFLKIKEESGRIVPFLFNKNQEELYDHIYKRHWKPFVTYEGKTRMRFQDIRHVSLKSRKWGESTFWRGLFFYDVITNEGCGNRIYCQDETYSKEMMKKDKIFLDNMPKAFKPKVEYDTLSYLSFPAINSDIKAEKPGASEAVAEKQGRSTDIYDLHCSEFAQWINPQVTMQGLMGALVDGANVVIESTAKKIADPFHGYYIEGKKAWPKV